MTFGNHSRNGRLRRLFSRPPGVPPSAPQMVLKLHLCHEDSEYVLGFEIGQRESGFYSERTDRITEPPNTVLVYRLVFFRKIYFKVKKIIEELLEVLM